MYVGPVVNTPIEAPASEMTPNEVQEIVLDLLAGADAETVLEDD